ncbi:MAG: asparaginase [Burkholderiales bacterium]|nr:asparaginase [Burkholderiales bacterium]
MAVAKVVVLGTGGTIAGTGTDQKALTYQAAQLGVDEVVEQVTSAAADLAGIPVESLQVAQIDSKDMDWSVWQDLARALQAELAREEVGAIVITHGTDTLEETAFLLDRLLDVSKPIVLTAAMRPATSDEADGPRNLHDALRVAHAAARQGQAGVVVVMAGKVWPGRSVRKVQSCQIDAFDGGGCAPLGLITDSGAITDTKDWPTPGGGGWACLMADQPPRVEIVTSHAGADGWVVDALLAQPLAGELKGLVVAGTGHGTIHRGLVRALLAAEERGVRIWRSTRVAYGGVDFREGDRWPAAGTLTPAQVRVALMLDLMGIPSAGIRA